MDYLTIKWLHILSSTVLFGTGLGSAFYFFVVNRSRHLPAIVEVSKWIVRADWWFTMPAILIQPLTGFLLIRSASFDRQSFWIIASLILFFVASLCWLPVVYLQIKMRDMAQLAHQQGTELPNRYWHYERCWTLLGIPAFAALVLVFWLMVNKPL